MKKFISILLSVVLSLSMFSLVACDLIGEDKPEHEHEYLKIAFDEQTHWKVCSCEEITDVSKHEDLDGDNKCDICGSNMPVSHTHSYGDYVKNASGHYKECSCGDKIENGAHKDNNIDYVCDVCGYEMERPTTHTHSYGNYVKNKSGHYKECSCGDKIENGAHKDNNTDYVCDVCGYEMERPQNPNPGNPTTPQAPQTPVVPNHPTTGDSSYLDKSAVEIYTNISDNLTKSGNYTFKSTQNVSVDVDLSTMMPGAGMIEGFGTQNLEFVYGYAGSEFYGREKYFIIADWTKISFMPPEEQVLETLKNEVFEIVCDDDIVYLFEQENGKSPVKGKDEGSFADLQNATGIPLNVKDNPLFVPSNNALSNGYFNMSNDADGGATLTIKISGAEAQTFIEQNTNEDITALAVSDIVYIVHLDAQGNLEKIDYYFQIYALFSGNLPAYYNYSCTTIITDVDKTVINAPSDADTYIDANFIK